MQNKVKILVIDDDEDICSFSKSILEKTGRYKVIVSQKAREGITLAKEHKPDLILLDVIMPEMDGVGVAKSLSEDAATQAIPVVFLTAVAIPMAFLASLVESDDLKQRAGELGGFYFIQKPITANQLVERIEAILNQKK